MKKRGERGRGVKMRPKSIEKERGRGKGERNKRLTHMKMMK